MLSTELKEQTKTAHMDLEKQVVRKMKAIRSHADYAEFLKCFYTYFSQVEQVIKPFISAAVLPDYPQRRNSSYLKNDIEALGGRVDDIPVVNVPEVENLAQAFGALYVMEGSIMGGSIIVKMLEKGGITEGVSFFSGYGSQTGQKWGVFTEAMHRQVSGPDQEAKAIKAANETFSKFAEVFDEVTASRS